MTNTPPTHGTVTATRGDFTYTALWRIRGNKLFVDFRGQEEPVLLGMFEKEPEALAHMLLVELIQRHFGRY